MVGDDALDKKMAGLREEDLARIAFSDESDGFEADYIEAAKAEIERRGISHIDINILKSDINEERLHEDSKAEEPLSPIGRALFFVFCGFLLAWLATAVLKFRGYDQKFRDAWRWILYGFGVYASIGVIFLIADVVGN